MSDKKVRTRENESVDGDASMDGENDVSFSRTLGFFDVTMIGVGAMIGAGIFVLTGIACGEGARRPCSHLASMVQ